MSAHAPPILGGPSTNADTRRDTSSVTRVMRGEFIFRANGEGAARLSEVLAHQVEPPRWSPEALAAAALAAPPNFPSQTVFRNVFREPLGDPLTPPIRSLSGLRSPREAASCMRQWLELAIDRALVGVRRVGVLASGGLDSAAVLALACNWAKRTGGTAFAVALDFEGPGDDRPYLRALEKHLPCDVLRVRPEQAARRLALIEGVDASPFPWPTGPFEVELLAAARENGAERCLSGAGGDELFDGNPRSLASYAREGNVGRAIMTARRLRGFEEERTPLLSWVARPLLAAYQPGWVRAWRERYTRASAPSWAGPMTHAFLRTRAKIAKDVAHRDYVAWLRHQEIVASGCDLQEPLFADDLVAAIRSLPPRWLLYGDVRRGLFREAMRDLLPESVRMRLDKARFEPALVRFFHAANAADRFRALSNFRHLKALGVVAHSFVAPALDVFAKEIEPWRALWPLFAVEAFLEAQTR